MDGIETRILVVEDNPDDVFLYKRALAGTGVESSMRFLANGEELIAFFENLASERLDPSQPESTTGRAPELVILDLKMPRSNGLDALAWLRRQPIFRRIPVVMISSSEAQDDIDRAYESGANAYIVKPLEFAKVSETLREICSFWLSTIRPPSATPLRDASV